MKVSRTRVRSAATVLAVAVLTMLPARSTTASMLSIVPQTSSLIAGQSETISVQFSNVGSPGFTLGDVDIFISYDTSRFTVTSATTGALTAGFSGSANISQPGYVLTSFYSNTGTAISSTTTGTVETFTLMALNNAPVGGSTGNINILAESPFGSQSPTAVYDLNANSIALAPAPTDGYDVGVDGTVLVTQPTPEPSSLILMSLGGGLIVLTSRFRKKAPRPSAA